MVKFCCDSKFWNTGLNMFHLWFRLQKLVKTASHLGSCYFLHWYPKFRKGGVQWNQKLWSTSGTPTKGRADVSVDPTVVSADVSESPSPYRTDFLISFRCYFRVSPGWKDGHLLVPLLVLPVQVVMWINGVKVEGRERKPYKQGWKSLYNK
jgi:hypothetical protein